MKMRMWAAAGLCVAGMMGCGDDGDGGGGGGVTPSSFSKQLSENYCSKTFDCCTAEEIQLNNELFSFETEEECNNLLGVLFQGLYPAQADIDAGKVEFNASAASALLSKAKGASCGEFFGEEDFIGSEGSQVYKGKVADGGECKSNVMCATPGASCTDEVCVPPAAVGSACESTFDCDTDASDLYCGADQKCAAKGAVGATCATDLECVSGACVAQKCEDKQATGGACDSSNDCTSASCNFDAQTCDAPKADGEQCFFDEECSSGSCDSNGVCVAATGPICDGL